MDQRNKNVAIVALGPSSQEFFRMAESAGDMKKAFDEVWSINTYGSVIRSDIVFHMDDVRVQMRRAEAGNTKMQGLVDWLRTYEGRVITSRAHPDFPCLEEFPLEEVLNCTPTPYFNGTVPYAVAYAIWRGDIGQIQLFGCDYNWRGCSNIEPGRACLEYWIGRATERGIQVGIANNSTLMDMNCRVLYGYDTLRVFISVDANRIKVKTIPKEDFPSAEEIEERYDHTVKELRNV